MNKMWSKAALGAVIFLAGRLFLAAYLLPGQAVGAAGPEPVQLLGEYSVDGGAWRPLTADTAFDTGGIHTTVFRGRLSRGIPEGQSLLLYIRNLYVTLKVDGETVYRFGAPEDAPFLGTPGITLAETCPGPVDRDAVVELTVQNAFRGTVPSIPDLLGRLSVGHRAQLYERLVHVSGPLVFLCLGSVLLGLLSLLLSLISRILRIPYAGKAAALGFFALTLGAWFLFSADCTFLPLLLSRPVAAAALDILSLYLMSLSGATLIHTFVGPAYRRYSGVFAGLVAAGQGILFLLQLLGLVQLYEVQFLVLPFTLLAAGGFAVLAVDAARNKAPETRLAAGCLIPAVAAGLLECANFLTLPNARAYAVSTAGFAATFLLLFLLLVYQMERSNDALLRAHALERDLMESRIAAAVRQIQPHFLYNALTAVEDLCETDPPRARKAVDDFAKYLRGNMSALTRRQPIPFAEELEHIRHYLDLEQLRFGEKLRVVLEPGPTRFPVPALSVQPIVENAVKHGVTRRKGGGAVTLRTGETAEAWVVTVEDDGAGFDPEAALGDGREHVGLQNVRGRLAAMVGGTLEIESAAGAGTTVTIRIPKTGPSAEVN